MKQKLSYLWFLWILCAFSCGGSEEENKSSSAVIGDETKGDVPGDNAFFELHEECIDFYLSPVLPEGSDFVFKEQQSVKTPRELSFLIDGDFASQTGGSDALAILQRNQGSTQLIYLIEKSFISGINLAIDMPDEDDRILFADSLIITEFVLTENGTALGLYQKLQSYIKEPTEALEEELLAEASVLEEGLSNALRASVIRLIGKEECGGIAGLQNIEENFSEIPFEYEGEKMDEATARKSALI
jgi:hypothetical protein